MDQTADLLGHVTRREQENYFMTHNFGEWELLERDHAICRMEIRQESKNPHGMVHGGALYTMADNAAGAAVHTDGRFHVTQNSYMTFLRNQPSGVLRAESRVTHRGRSTSQIHVEITNEEGKVLATGEFSFFCIDKARMDEKAHKKADG